MTTALDRMAAGFADPALDSQAVFRAALQAFSRPGLIQALPELAFAPPAGGRAAAALLLALLDPDCRLWLSPALACGEAGGWLRFHTGCSLVDDPAQAGFAWIASAAEMPPLSAFAAGTEFDPETSATCLVEVDSLEAGAGWTLTGPGVKGSARLAVQGLGAGFGAEWRRNHAAFPRGVDLLLCAGGRFAGLARTTALEG